MDTVSDRVRGVMASHPESGSPAPSGRLVALDIARFFGIFLVYYGHVVEQTMYLGNAAAASQYKFIYSFHMPLFFVLSGVIAKDWGKHLGLAAFAKSRLASRILPFLLFNVALVLVSLAATPAFPPIPLHTAADYGNAIVLTITRIPVFNIPTWFLMCLVSVEIIHALVFRFLRVSDLRIGVAIIAFYLAGYALNLEWNVFGDGVNYWFWNEAITMYAFYLVGVLIARNRVLDMAFSKPILASVAIVAVAIVYFTYGLNQGPFRMKMDAVVILAAAHGQMVWFAVTALVGTAAILLLAAAVPAWRWLRFMGRNALIFFCLNGVVYHQVNPRLAPWFIANWPQSGWSLFVYAFGLSAISLIAAVPVALALNRYVPQLVGRPTVSGPWLPALLRSGGSDRKAIASDAPSPGEAVARRPA